MGLRVPLNFVSVAEAASWQSTDLMHCRHALGLRRRLLLPRVRAADLDNCYSIYPTSGQNPLVGPRECNF